MLAYASPLSERYYRVPRHSIAARRFDVLSQTGRAVGMKFRRRSVRYGQISDKMSERELRPFCAPCHVPEPCTVLLFVLIVLQNFQLDRASFRWGSRSECKFGRKVKQEERQKEERIGHLQGVSFQGSYGQGKSGNFEWVRESQLKQRGLWKSQGILIYHSLDQLFMYYFHNFCRLRHQTPTGAPPQTLQVLQYFTIQQN